VAAFAVRIERVGPTEELRLWWLDRRSGELDVRRLPVQSGPDASTVVVQAVERLSARLTAPAPPPAPVSSPFVDSGPEAPPASTTAISLELGVGAFVEPRSPVASAAPALAVGFEAHAGQGGSGLPLDWGARLSVAGGGDRIELRAPAGLAAVRQDLALLQASVGYRLEGWPTPYAVLSGGA
jgi:hypothetical protein